MNKIILFLSISFFITNSMSQEKIVQTAGRTQLGEFAPKFAELNDDVLFGEVWSRTDKLGLHDRSLVTVTSLISQGITDNSLVFHLQSAKKNGVCIWKVHSTGLAPPSDHPSRPCLNLRPRPYTRIVRLPIRYRRTLISRGLREPLFSHL